MSRFTRLGYSFVVACFAAAQIASACAVQQRPAPTPNPAHEVRPVGTLEGRVTAINRAFLQPGTGETAVISLRLAGDPPIVVQLAPGWYMDERGLHFSREDRITVTGSQTHKANEIEVLAHEVKKGNVHLLLRDAEGRPLWTQPGAEPASATPAAQPSSGAAVQSSPSPGGTPTQSQPATTEGGAAAPAGSLDGPAPAAPQPSAPPPAPASSP